jgi:hypothetical protein
VLGQALAVGVGCVAYCARLAPHGFHRFLGSGPRGWAAVLAPCGDGLDVDQPGPIQVPSSCLRRVLTLALGAKVTAYLVAPACLPWAHRWSPQCRSFVTTGAAAAQPSRLNKGRGEITGWSTIYASVVLWEWTAPSVR